jgi:hypothetical protein
LRIFFPPIIIISAGFGRPARARPGVRSFREKGEPTVADVHVYVNRPAGKVGTNLEDLEEALRKLEYVSEVEPDPPGNVVAVSFEGGPSEQEGIERAVEEAGYEVSRISVRTTSTEE